MQFKASLKVYLTFYQNKQEKNWATSPVIRCFAYEAIYRTSLLFPPLIGGRQSIFCSLPVVFEYPFPDIAFRNTSGSWVLDYIKRSELDQRVFHNSFADPAKRLDLLIKSNILD